jgi:putative spermidine/putrescine transport system substrate-binding protein
MVKVKAVRYAFLAFYVACALSCGSSNSTEREIVAISYAGDLQVPHRKFLADPFMAAHPGVGVKLIPSESEDVVAQIKATRGASPYDVIPLGEPRQITAIQEDWIEQTPREALPNLKDVHPQFIKACRNYGVPETYSLVGLAYNPDLVPEPKNWTDLWKNEYRVKIGLTTPASNLGFSFMALVAKLYGGSESDFGPAWPKLKELEPFVVAPNPTALAQLFERGEIAIAPLWNNDAASLAGKGLKVKFAQPAPGMIMVVSCLDVIKSSAHLELSRDYINRVASAEYQSQAVRPPWFFGPTNIKVKVPEDSIGYLPASVDDLFKAIIPMDWEAAARQRGPVTAFFNREFSR